VCCYSAANTAVFIPPFHISREESPFHRHGWFHNLQPALYVRRPDCVLLVSGLRSASKKGFNILHL
ncbi:unnamed protein product, partial [Allacma fusca]